MRFDPDLFRERPEFVITSILKKVSLNCDLIADLPKQERRTFPELPPGSDPREAADLRKRKEDYERDLPRAHYTLCNAIDTKVWESLSRSVSFQETVEDKRDPFAYLRQCRDTPQRQRRLVSVIGGTLCGNGIKDNNRPQAFVAREQDERPTIGGFDIIANYNGAFGSKSG